MPHAVSEWIGIEELRRLLALVDVFERLPPEELRVLASGASLERLKVKETMMVGPREHARRVIVLLSGRATVYEPGPRGHRLTVSVAEAGTLVGVADLSERPRGLRLEASMPCTLCLLAREAFEGGGAAQSRGGSLSFCACWARGSACWKRGSRIWPTGRFLRASRAPSCGWWRGRA